MDIVGTVSAAISFVDFIGKAIGAAEQAADTGEAVQEHHQLDELAQTVRESYHDIQMKLAQNSVGTLSAPERNLLEVLEHCIDVHDRIRALRDKGTVDRPEGGKGKSLADRGRDQIRYRAKVGGVAIRVIWSMKKDGKDLRDQFTACTAALHSSLLLVMRKENLDKWESAANTLRDVLASRFDDQRQNRESFMKVNQKCDAVFSLVRELSHGSNLWNERLQAVHEKITRESEIQKAWSEELGELKELFKRFDGTAHELAYARILDKISFGDMRKRANDIKATRIAPKTFEWILYDPPRSTNYTANGLGKEYQRWLRERDGVFYIMGKPGSGKSALMSFLASHSETKLRQGQWEPSRQVLIVASVFFWNRGSTHQKSKEGLYRTLLYTILSRSPGLISQLFPDRFKAQRGLIGNLTQPSFQSLPFSIIEEKLEELLADPPTDMKLCFFIDGVDEFHDPNTENYELAQILRRWSHNSWVKICLADREEQPWVAGFGRGPRLRLQDATTADIRLMVEKSISNHDRFLEFDHRQRHEFITSFVRKAEGVLYGYGISRTR